MAMLNQHKHTQELETVTVQCYSGWDLFFALIYTCKEILIQTQGLIKRRVQGKQPLLLNQIMPNPTAVSTA